MTINWSALFMGGLFSLIPAYMARKRDRNALLFFILSMVFSPVIMTIVLLLIGKKE